MEDKRTPAEWEKLTGITVLDPDGWRIDCKSWDELITESEWNQRMGSSTCKFPRDYLDGFQEKP